MATAEPALSSSGDPVLSSSTALSGRILELANDGTHTHPQRALAASTLALTRSFKTAVDHLDVSEVWMEKEGKTLPVLANSIRDLSYSAAELFETLVQSVPESLTPSKRSIDQKRKRDLRTKAKRSRDGWSMLCNKCKHNHHVVVAARYSYSLGFSTACCFSLLQPDGPDKLKFNKDYHRGQEKSRGARIMMIQLIADIFHVDKLLADFILGLTDEPNGTQFEAKTISIGIGASLSKLLSRPAFNVPGATSMYDRAMFDQSNGILRFQRTQAMVPAGKAEVTGTFQGDGITRTFPLL